MRTGRKKREYKIFQLNSLGKLLVDTHSDKTYAIKKAARLAHGNRNLIQVEWSVDNKNIVCKFDVFGDWYL